MVDMKEFVLPFSDSEWISLHAGESVLLSGRVFLGGNEALDRLMFYDSQNIMLNLELSGCVWIYATSSRDFSQSEWIQDPIPKEYLQTLGEFGVSMAGISLFDQNTWQDFGVRCMIPEDKEGWFPKDALRRTKSCWWMEGGLRYALWELEVQGLGPFAVV